MRFETQSGQMPLPQGYSYHPEGYLWFILPEERFTALPGVVEVAGETFKLKSEFHVTVINARRLAHMIAAEHQESISELERQIQGHLVKYLQGQSIEFVGFDDDLRLASSGDRKSIAVRVHMRGITGFFKYLESLYQVSIPAQPTHISLYTITGAAVGIDTDQQMDRYARIELPEVGEVLSSIKSSGLPIVPGT